MGYDATITLKFIFKDENLHTAQRLYEILNNSTLLNENKSQKDYIKFEEHKHENELLPPRTYHEITVYKYDDWNFWLERWGLMSIITGLEKYAEGSINDWWDKSFIIISSISRSHVNNIFIKQRLIFQELFFGICDLRSGMIIYKST